MPEHVTFTVTGTPATQGSKRHVGGGRMIEQAKGLPAWRKAVHTAAQTQAVRVGRFDDGPLRLRVAFHLPHGKQRETSPWRAKDLDKLIRAVGDALKTGGLITDDSRIVHITATKHWALDEPGATITLEKDHA